MLFPIRGIPFPEVFDRAPKESRWLHLKSKGIYEVVGYAILYVRVDNVLIVPWCRPADEFLDGRFQRVEGDPS